MLLNYYNLRRQPFGVTPDPQFLLMSRTHREAFASLSYGLREERGFMALVAPPGMGKTTLLFRLLESLRDCARTAFLFQTQCDPREFFSYLLRELGLEPDSDLASTHDQLNQVLLEEASAGRRFVLIVDEAQGLQSSVLETIRLLSNFETSGRKLLQIIIAGQLGLVETLTRTEMEQLRQRISIIASLKPFNQEEVIEYIGHRLSVAGHQGVSLFTEEALQMIASGSAGIPRNINSICFNTLSIGYALKKKRIGRDIVEEVLADRKIESLLPMKRVDVPRNRSQRVFGVPAFLPARQKASRKAPLIGVVALMIAIISFTAFGHNSTPIISSVRQWLIARPPSATRQDETAEPPELPAQLTLQATDSNVGTRVEPPPKVVVIAPGQTLAEISRHSLGAYTSANVARLMASNPSLTSPDHIEAGRKLRLPAAVPEPRNRL